MFSLKKIVVPTQPTLGLLDINIYTVGVIALFAMISFVRPVEASDQQTTTTDNLDEVVDLVIVGSRTESLIENIPADITVITADQIKTSGATSIEQILAGVSSVQVSDNATNSTLSLRGFSAEQAGSNTLILVNGRRLNYSDLAAPQLATIPLNEIVRIEILNTSAGVVYGDQAVGGVINIVTLSAQNSGYGSAFAPFTELNLVLGSNNLQQLRFAKSFEINQQWSLMFSAKDKATDNFREHNKEQLEQQQLSLNYGNEKLSFTFSFDATDQNIETPGALLGSDLLVDRKSSRTEFENDFLDIKSRNFRISNYFKFADNWKFEADLQKNKEDNQSLTSFVNFANSFVSETNRELFSFNPRISSTIETGYGNGSITFGIDVIESDYSFSLLGRSNQQKLNSGYAYLQLPITNRVKISGGARASRVKDQLTDGFTYAAGVELKNNASALNLGVIVDLKKGRRLFARIEENYRFAKVDEQAYTSPNVVGLEPQTGVSIDAGVESNQPQRFWKFSVYQLKLENEIIFDSSALPPTGAFFQGANVNADKSTREGVKFELKQSFNDALQASINLNWVDARFTSGFNNGNKIAGVASNTAKIKLTYQTDSDNSFLIEQLYLGERKQEGDSSGFFPKLKSYSLVNIAYYHRFSNSFENLQLSGRVNNLLNKEYINFAQFNGFYPAVGITASVTLNYQFD